MKAYHTIYQLAYEYEFLVYPLAASSVGFSSIGLYGATGGTILGLIDALALQYNLYDKLYLNSATLSISAAYPFRLPYKLNQSIYRFNELNRLMDESHMKVCYYYNQSGQLKICFNNLKLSRANISTGIAEPFLYIGDLCLIKQKIAITCSSESGKISLLK